MEAYEYRVVVALRDDSDFGRAALAALLLSGQKADLAVWAERPIVASAEGVAYRFADTSLWPSQIADLPDYLGILYSKAAYYEGGGAFDQDGGLLGGVWFTRVPGTVERGALDVLAAIGLFPAIEEEP